MRRLRWAGIYGLGIAVILLVRIGLWVTTYQRIRAALVRPCPSDPQPERHATVWRVIHAVERMAPVVPDASCLTQTISAQALLSWKGIPTTISLGLRPSSENGLDAHAWLVWNGRVVLQGDEDALADFSKILDLPTPQPPLAAS